MASPTLFKDKVIAITGAASGIGLATALYLAVRGASISLADNRREPLDEAVELIRKAAPDAGVLAQVVDVTKSADVQSWISNTVQRFGRLSGAANLAGVVGKSIGRVGVANYDEDEWDFVINVNLKGVFLCMKAQLQAVESGGSIVNAASIAGVRGLPNNGAYVASKHGVVGLTRAASKECTETEVRINVICPGTIDTPMSAKSSVDPNWKMERPATLKRKGQPEEAAALVAFLLGDESKFITGAVHSIDGGWNC
ncbi:hypothetical protein CLAIMM_14563 [Cladophialophora immunda]|nr:hypothetical protein CLAIMM_14563 [Cladophialophora immunda]